MGRQPWVWAVLAAAVAAGLGGCGRLDRLNRGLAAVTDERAGEVLRDCLWADGSHYRWMDHETIRCEVMRTDHRPLGDKATEEIWWLDIWGGRVRIERPSEKEVITCDGLGWHVFVGGRRTQDAVRRAEAAGAGRMVRELVTMPLSLILYGREIGYLGERIGPAEARTWDRLIVAYGEGGSPRAAAAGDRMVAEIERQSRRVDAVLVCWSEWPFLGRRFRVAMDDWRPVTAAGGSADEVLVSHRWRFFPVDEAGATTGPPYYTIRIRKAEFDVRVGWGTFSGP